MSALPYAEAAALARHIMAMTGPDRTAAAQAAVIAHGGTLVPAMPGGNWGPHYAEISLLGISHTGDTVEGAVANWIKAALRSEAHMEGEAA
jgi:hypothetical protein